VRQPRPSRRQLLLLQLDVLLHHGDLVRQEVDPRHYQSVFVLLLVRIEPLLANLLFDARRCASDPSRPRCDPS
jgi:hypothetical protein